MLFNSALETGVRAVIVLNAYYPKALGIEGLILMDHLAVHTADVGGPASLHVSVPHRGGELLIRKPIIEQGVNFMRRIGLINMIVRHDGFFYQASENSQPFVRLLKTKYNLDLIKRASWLAENITEVDHISIERITTQKISRWKMEFYENESQIF